MDNSKKTVHSSGPLGMLVRSGQVKRIDVDNENSFSQAKRPAEFSNDLGSYFRTSTGVVFNENELVSIDPKQCKPWKYANRLEDNMGDMQELIQSIKENGQLQPGLIRPHPKPYSNIKYEVIFGRRRYEACLQLNIPFLAIKKNLYNVEEALVVQETENRARKDISNYSNAMLYKKLFEDMVFKNEKDLSEKMGMSLSKVYDIMAYSKIPTEIVTLIPDIHALSNSLAIKIASVVKESPQLYSNLLRVASQIGKTITSPAKLEASLSNIKENEENKYAIKAKSYKSSFGKKLFTFKINHKGAPCIVIDRTIKNVVHEKLCQYLVKYLEDIYQTREDESVKYI
jgi:ParB family chromosome partitioning protein